MRRARKARKQRTKKRPEQKISGGLSRADSREFGVQRNSLALALAHTPIRANPCSPLWWAMLQLSGPKEARNLAARNQSNGPSKKAGRLPLSPHWPEL